MRGHGTKIRILLALAILVAAPLGAAAQTFHVTLNPAYRTLQPGIAHTINYSATLTNLGSSTVFINGNSFTMGGPGLTLDDTKFFMNVPVSLAAGASVTVDIFDVLVSPTTAIDTYFNNFTVLGGTTATSMDELATVHFVVSLVPEGSSLALFGAALLSLGLLVRRAPRGAARRV